MEEEENGKEFNSVQELLDYIEEIYSGWIVGKLDNFSKDYDFLNQNWIYVATKLINVEKQQIILVKNFTDHVDSFKLAELLTRFGFVVRSEADFTPCPSCQLAIPSESVYDIMKKNDKKVPDKWSNTCSSCL